MNLALRHDKYLRVNTLEFAWVTDVIDTRAGGIDHIFASRADIFCVVSENRNGRY